MSVIHRLHNYQSSAGSSCVSGQVNVGITWKVPGGGGTDLERGYGDVRPWRPPFHASPAACKGPIPSKRVSSQDPLLRTFGNFQLTSPQNLEIFSSQAPKFGNFQLTSPQIWKFSAHKPPKFGNFQLTSPQIWKFSAHKPPFSEANVSSQAPHFGNPGRTPLPEKSWVPPGWKVFCSSTQCTWEAQTHNLEERLKTTTFRMMKVLALTGSPPPKKKENEPVCMTRVLSFSDIMWLSIVSMTLTTWG